MKTLVLAAGLLVLTQAAPALAGDPGDTLPILARVMALPQAGAPVTTSIGGVTIPGALPALATRPPTGPFRPNEVLVVLPAGSTADTAAALAQTFNLQLEVFTPSATLGTPLVRMRITDNRPVVAVLQALAQDPRVRASQPNYVYRLSAGAGAPASGLPQYALDMIHARDALARLNATRTPLVAVIDTGIDEGHPDLAGAVREHFDAVGDGQWDAAAHGTSIAGIIGARGQLQGVDPQASLLSVRAFPAGDGATAEATSLALVRGIDWALAQNADVINMSLAGPPDQFVDAAVERAMAAGVIIVAAAGNGGPDAPPAFPAAVKGVVAVTATDDKDALFAGANRGSYISLAAPGVDIMSDAPGGGVALATGTSQAAAHVSGVLALLRTASPQLSPADALKLLGRTARGHGKDGFGAGLVDAAAAVDALGK